MNNNIIEQYCFIIKDKISQRRFDAALESINKLIQNFPQCEKGYYYRAVCEFANENYNEAINYYNKAIEINPANSKAYFNAGICYYQIAKFDEALINIGKALILFSKTRDLEAKKKCVEALQMIESEKNAKN